MRACMMTGPWWWETSGRYRNVGLVADDLVKGMGKHVSFRYILKVVVHVVLLFRLDRWVMNPRMGL